MPSTAKEPATIEIILLLSSLVRFFAPLICVFFIAKSSKSKLVNSYNQKDFVVLLGIIGLFSRYFLVKSSLAFYKTNSKPFSFIG